MKKKLNISNVSLSYMCRFKQTKHNKKDMQLYVSNIHMKERKREELPYCFGYFQV